MVTHTTTRMALTGFALMWTLALSGCEDAVLLDEPSGTDDSGLETSSESPQSSSVGNKSGDNIDLHSEGSCDTCIEPGKKLKEKCYDVESLNECAVETVPRGLYVLVKWGAADALDRSLLKLPFISGTAVRSYWKDLELSPGHYDWTKLDKHFDWAKAEGKGVRLAIATGVYSPAWLIATQDGDTTCEKANLPGISEFGVQTFCAHVPNGDYKDQLHSFPVPWDAVLHKRWLLFLRALSKHLEGADEAKGPDRIAILDWIAVTGPGGHNGEVSHPDPEWLELPLRSPLTNDLIDSNADLVDAFKFSWERALDDFDALFGGRQIYYTLSLVFKSFALGTDTHNLDWNFKKALLRYGLKLPNALYFGVQTNGLDDAASWATTTPWPNAKKHWKLVRNHRTAGQTFTGFQTRGMANLYGDDKEAKTACGRARVWKGLVTNAKCMQVDVVEVYAPDVNKGWDHSCEGGGIRAELEKMHAWLTD